MEFKLRSARALAAMAAAGALAAAVAGTARAEEKVTYLFPAPPVLPAFGPIQLAKGKGYFKAAGLEVAFQVGKGGVDVAKQVGAGNAPLGGGLADGPIIVRAQGIPVRAVGVFGGKGFMQLAVRNDAGIKTPADLKGKTVAVAAFQDTTYYALRGMLASAGLKESDVTALPLGFRAPQMAVIEGKAQACACVADWLPAFHQHKVPFTIIKSEDYFPHMAQAILASDDVIKKNPKMVKAFVGAAMKGMKDIMANPEASAKEFAAFVPAWKGKEGYITAVFKYYAELVYPGQAKLGEMNVERLKKLQAFYVSQGIARTAVPIEELYTNEFVQ